MIHEFAIDPAALNSCQTLHRFLDQLGFRHGRMISRLPTNWKDQVMNNFAGMGVVSRQLIDARLTEMERHKRRHFLLGRSYNPQQSWFDNAEAQHRAQEFRAIITSANPGSRPHVLAADGVNNTVERWNVPNQMFVSRSATAMAQGLALFLKASSKIIFVDPYFDPEIEQFFSPLEQFLARAISTGKRLRVEYHTKRNCSRNDFETKCRTYLPQCIPQGVIVTFVRWTERPRDRKNFHDRFILTDIGGVSFGQGLRAASASEDVLLQLLHEDIHQELLTRFDYGKRYSPRVSAFGFDYEVSITGTKV